MRNDPPMFGDVAKLKTGQIVEVTGCDNNAQTCDVIAQDGKPFTVAYHETSRLSADEHLVYLKFKSTISN